MPGYIPDEATATTYARQAVPMMADFDNLLSNINGYAVVAGCAITAGTGLSVSMAAGTALVAERFLAVSAAIDQALAAADATHPRLDAIVLNAAGTFTIRAGTAAAQPSAPSLTDNDILLALVWVPAAASSLTSTNIRDKRLLRAPKGTIYAVAPLTNYTTTQTNTAVATGITIPANLLKVGAHLRLKAIAVSTTVASAGTLTIRALVGGSALATTGAVSLTASQTGRPLAVEIDMVVTAIGASGAAILNGVARVGTSATAAAHWAIGASAGTANTATTTINTTNALTLTLDFSLSVAQTAFRWTHFTIEWL